MICETIDFAILGILVCLYNLYFSIIFSLSLFPPLSLYLSLSFFSLTLSLSLLSFSLYLSPPLSFFLSHLFSLPIFLSPLFLSVSLSLSPFFLSLFWMRLFIWSLFFPYAPLDKRIIKIPWLSECVFIYDKAKNIYRSFVPKILSICLSLSVLKSKNV